VEQRLYHTLEIIRSGEGAILSVFVPVTRTLETEMLLSELEGQRVPLRLAMRKDQLVAYICLDGQEWLPFQPREASQDDLDEGASECSKRDIKKTNRYRARRP
jgi:hypothetical protein